MFLQVILNSVLILIGETERSSINNNGINNTNLTTEYRLPDYIRPMHYILNIQFFNVEINNFSCDSTIYIKIEQPTWNISLHAQLLQIKIKNITFIKKEPSNLSDYLSDYVPIDNITLTYNNESNILIFQFSKEISEGNYVLEMQFDTILHDGESIFKTFLVNEKGYTSWFLATSFQTIGARQLFPCWDEPKFKSVFSINIKHHRSYIALSNMWEDLNEREIVDEHDVMKWTRFDNTSVIPTYLVAFLLTSNVSYEVMKVPEVEINIWCRANLVPHIQFAKSVIADVISFIDKNMVTNEHLEEHLEEMLTMQHILIPNLPHNSIQKWKLIFYRETTVVYDNEVDSFAHKIQIAHLIAREMVHQWLNIRMNSTSWWSYHWLYEGLATLFATDIVKQIYPESRMTELYIVQMQQESLRLDTHSIMQPLTSTINKSSEINSLFSFSYYIKAPSIMRMLRYLFTDVFHEGLEIFFKKQSATLDDFWDAMQTVYNKMEIPMRKFSVKFNIKEKLNPWALQKHYPVLEVRELDDGYLSISVSNIDSLELKWWCIPLTVAIENHSHFITQYSIRDDQWITLSGNTKVFVPRRLDKWIIVNLQQKGYYRVNYESSNWLKIAKYLNKKNFTNIHVLTRAQIIDDAYHFTMNGQLNSSIFFELIKYLSQEKDYVAWYPMFKALEDMSTILQFPGKKIDELKINLMNNLFELLLEIKYDESSQDDDLIKCLRHEAAKWLCLLGDTECWMIANSKLKKHLANSTETNRRLFQEWKDWMYCNGLIASNSLTWDAIWQTYTWKLDRKLLKFLCCSTNVFTIKYKMLARVPIDHHEQIQDIDHLYYFHTIIEMHAKHNEVLNYILMKFIDLKPKQFSAVAVLIDLINHVYSEEQLEMIKEFAEQILKDEITVILEYDIITQDEINQCVANVVRQYISIIHHKIQQRSYQITNQKYRFRHLLST